MSDHVNHSSENEPENGSPFHDQALSSRLLEAANASIPLQILPSKIPGAGFGLFVSESIDAGREIFRSEAMINSVANEMRTVVCDYCYSNNASPIHPAGRFYTATDGKVPMKHCGGCKFCHYCSRECQRKAWKKYHRLECAMFAKLPHLEPRTRVLYRLLNMKKKGDISTDQWRILNGLHAHVEEHLSSENAELTVGGVMYAASTMESLLEDEEILKIYCMLLTNCLCIHPAVGGTSGTSFDPVASLMNHSCNPNAFVFFEGSSLRVRSIRPIRAEEEITQCYADVDMDVTMRRKTLRNDFFFDCFCDRCEEQLRSHEEMLPGKVDQLQNIQQQLLIYVNQATMHAEVADTTELEADMTRVARDVFSRNEWPDDLEPLPSIRLQIAEILKVQGKFSSALKSGLKGCLHLEWRRGPTWVRHLFALLQILANAVMAPDPSVRRDPAYPTEGQLWSVLLGYLNSLVQAALETFGEDVAYTKAIRNWHSQSFQVSNAHQPGTRAFKDSYMESQSKLLLWAGIDSRRAVALL